MLLLVEETCDRYSQLLLLLSSVPCLYKVLVDVRAVFEVLRQPTYIVDSGKASPGGDGGIEIRVGSYC